MDVSHGPGGADRKPEVGQDLGGGSFAAMPFRRAGRFSSVAQYNRKWRLKGGNI